MTMKKPADEPRKNAKEMIDVPCVICGKIKPYAKSDYDRRVREHGVPPSTCGRPHAAEKRKLDTIARHAAAEARAT